MTPPELFGFSISAVGILCLAAGWFLGRNRSAPWLYLALNNIDSAILTADKDGRVTGLNPVAEKLTGWTLKEARNRPVADLLRLVDHDTRVAVEIPALQALRTGKTIQLPANTLLIERDGSEFPMDINITSMRTRLGRIKGVIILFRDITERYTVEQRLKESEERLKAVTNAVRLGLVMINRDRRYIYANNFYLQLVGISGTNVLGKRVEDVLPVLYEQIRHNLDKAFAGERLSYEVKGLHKKEQGLGRTYSVTYEPQKHHSLVTHVVIVVVDITDMKKAAELAAQKDKDDLKDSSAAIIAIK